MTPHTGATSQGPDPGTGTSPAPVRGPRGMGVSIILGLAAIRSRDIARRRAWMARAYALALGAGRVINLAVAEWFIRRPSARRARRARTRAALAGSQ